jgi:iodotyrosine deiodinase
MGTPQNSVTVNFVERPLDDMRRAAREYAELLHRRRTVREFDARPVPRDIIETCLHAAGSAPSGANQQPWRFVAVSDPLVKKQIREAAEAEEREFYGHRATDQWLEALAPLGTDDHKPFLEIAPWLIAIFIERFGVDANGEKQKRYYPDESVGIATGMLISALHVAGLATLTHTPSPMKFLNEILGRPKDIERPFLLLVVGYPALSCRVPDIKRLPFEQIASFR